MKVCNVERLPNGIEVWHYQRQVEYLVRQINVCEDGCKSYLVKSSCGKLYQFDCVEDSPEKLIERIEDGEAEGQMYESLYQSIYDENPNPFLSSKMNSMKGINIIAVAIMIAMACIPFLSSCGGDEPSSGNRNTTSQGNGSGNGKNTENEGNTKTYKVKGVEFKMVSVSGGTFTMGATAEQGIGTGLNEKPPHQVTLSSYSIGQTEVTQDLWQVVMGSNPSRYIGNLQRPVEHVSWNDCQTFIIRLNELTGKNFRLPTEAEWEYAARGGNHSQGYRYAGSNHVDHVAWYNGNSSITHPVATMTPNELGLYDMSGNVEEWCQDWFDSYSSAAQTNPTGPSTGSRRVTRGGCWSVYAPNCRVAYRNAFPPSFWEYNLGLRLAL